MFLIIPFIIIGVLVGFFLNNKLFNKISVFITILIWLLLFLLGIEVGSNKELIKSLDKIGIDVFLITIGAVAGSGLFSWLLWKAIHQKNLVNRKRQMKGSDYHRIVFCDGLFADIR